MEASLEILNQLLISKLIDTMITIHLDIKGPSDSLENLTFHLDPLSSMIEELFSFPTIINNILVLVLGVKRYSHYPTIFVPLGR